MQVGNVKCVVNFFHKIAFKGGRPTDFGPPYPMKTQHPTKVYSAQPQKLPKQSPVVKQPVKFVKAETLSIHLGSGTMKKTEVNRNSIELPSFQNQFSSLVRHALNLSQPR